MTPFLDAQWLAFIFGALMAVSVLAYVVLDGYDLGVGILLPFARDEAERDRMIASIGPFWDANETWLVLGVGLLLVAFPVAHGIILTALYLPVALMLVGLTMRGVAFEFRAKSVGVHDKRRWDHVFTAGSLLSAGSQGWMLGRYILGFDTEWQSWAFAAMAAIGLAIGYIFIAACWLIWRCEGDLQKRAVFWARLSLPPVALGIVMVSAATPLVSARIFERWFGWPNALVMAPLPILTLGVVWLLWRMLARMPYPDDARAPLPFLGAVMLFVGAFTGLAWSFFPYVIPERLTIYQAASSPEALSIILVGALCVLPVILLYTVVSWRVFAGKATDLRYD
jgi:cytochrome bd ubiquinol oxidase subunit II